jgi:Rrf2 family protein
MRLSTQGSYALEAALAIALQPSASRISVRAVSSLTGLSDGYLGQIFNKLRVGRIITSARGNRGGYCLARASDQITIGDVLRASEGSLAPVRCTETGAAPCGRKEFCLTRPVWAALETTISQFVDQLTLADLALLCRNQASGDAQDPAVCAGRPGGGCL